MGKRVQCPECKGTFTAKSPDEDPPPPSKPGTSISKPPPSKKAEWDKDDDDDDDRGSRSGRSKRRDDDDDDRGSRSGRSKRRDYDDDDDDEDDRRSRRSRRSSRPRYTAHRGGMILAFGLIGLIGHFVALGWFSFVFGLIAWIMGNADMEEMRKGRMDPEGEGMTQAGRIMGMISVILFIVALLIGCGIVGCIFLIPLMAIGGAAAGAGAGGPPRRKF
jgi:hypothetical protein